MRGIRRGVIAGASFLLAAAGARAATYYVATNGSDIAAGSLAQPFASLARAQQAASSGDTIYIRGGT